MASRDVPGLGLKAEWDLFETSWKSGMDENLRRLSLLVQLRVHGIVAVLPSGANQGDRYIYADNNSPYNQHIAVWDLGIWVFYPPEPNMMCINMETNVIHMYVTDFGGWAALTSPEAIKTIYEGNPDTNAFSDNEKDKLASIENGATADMTAAEIKAAYESNANTNVFTDTEKAKLNNLAASRFLGVYPTLTSLRAAHPAPPEGSFAYVDQGPNTDIMSYIWDANDLKYVPQASGNTQETPESVKAKYEANDDTNVFTDAEKLKLESFDPDAPSLPNGGTTGQVLAKQSNADGDAVWINPPIPEDELPPTTGQGGKVLGIDGSGNPVWIDPPESYPALGGNAGRVLTVRADETGVQWRTPASGGADNLYPLGADATYNPFMKKRGRPNLGDFPLTMNIGTAVGTISDGVDGILFTSANGTVENTRMVRAKTLDAGWSSIEFEMNFHTHTGTWDSSGLMLIASNGAFITFGMGTNGSSQKVARILRFSAAGAWLADVTAQFTVGQASRMWFRVVNKNNTLFFYISYDGIVWTLVSSYAYLAAYPSRFSHVGISANKNNVVEYTYYADDNIIPSFNGFLNAGLPLIQGKQGQVLMVDELGEGLFWATIPNVAMPVKTEADDYILSVEDMNGYLRMNSPDNLSVLVPHNSTLPILIGSSILVRQVGMGQITLVPESTVILNTAETLRTRKRGSVISLLKVAENEWDVHGDLEPEVI